MYKLTKADRCLLCRKLIKRGTFVYSVWIGETQYVFCQKHRSRHYGALATTILRYRKIIKENGDMSLIDAGEYRLLIEAGVI